MQLRSNIEKIVPLLPLMVIYLVVVYLFSSDALIGDEGRYIRYANNIVNGFYTDKNKPDLLNGPGYPLILTPIVALKLSLLIPKVLNAVFAFTGVVYLFLTLKLFTRKKYALIGAFLFGLYPPMIRFIPYLLTESVTMLLICAFIYYICRLYQAKSFKWKYVLAASFSVAYLILVKMIFFYVLVAVMIALAAGTIFYRRDQLRRPLLVILLGLLFISPYLAYAYYVTGKPFYLGTGGGEILYHRSTPYEGERGNWFSEAAVLKDSSEARELKVYSDLTQLSNNHHEFYEELIILTPMEKDSVFKSRALKNMKIHPGKYIENTISNLGRLLFHFPFSYRLESLSSYGYMIPNMFLVVFCVVSIIPLWMSRKKLPFEIKSILVFFLIYGCAIVLLDGRGRNFIAMVPSLLIYIVFINTNILNISVAEPKGRQE